MDIKSLQNEIMDADRLIERNKVILSLLDQLGTKERELIELRDKIAELTKSE